MHMHWWCTTRRMRNYGRLIKMKHLMLNAQCKLQIANCAYAVYARSAIELVANVFYTPTTSMG